MFYDNSYLLAEVLQAICWEEVGEDIFRFVGDVWPDVWTMASHLKTQAHYLLNYDFKLLSKMLIALCLNKASSFKMALYKMYTMYSILKRR